MTRQLHREEEETKYQQPSHRTSRRLEIDGAISLKC